METKTLRGLFGLPIKGWASFFNRHDLKLEDILVSLVALETRCNKTILPRYGDVFKAFKHTSHDDVRVIILGQDPYPNSTYATGLAFGVPKGTSPVPPSLRNIFVELGQEGYTAPKDTSLSGWAKQGVLLLNSSLTVEEGNIGSHQERWHYFTSELLRSLASHSTDIILVLWGKWAQNTYRQAMERGTYYFENVLVAPHPSPLAAHSGFFGCNHFKIVNKILAAQGKKEIDWSK